ncbi:hypothetical protein PAPYR_4016 [Paratrimastix pyriformis]|uniref:Transposase n=1 Tax=Paratrimastix pyriformis TaxID=342808 RepID=A0ABQ8UL65_9EUKA|nr:hypothetical protein PAPYR_4016 [Paratrimastix pyriformis]
MRVYADETPVYLNEARRFGRSKKGHRIFRLRPHHARRLTLHVYIKEDRVLHWDLSSKNANDAEVLRVALGAAQKWTDGDVLLWDRLGRSGRARHPKAQHYNPEAIDAIECAGGAVVHLSPKGKYLDPCELLFNDLKENNLRRTPRKWDLPTLKVAISRYMRQVAPAHLAGFFRARANGRDLIRAGLLRD